MRRGDRTAVRICGAVALLGMGAVHLQQYIGAEYSELPTIGTLFVLNFAGAVVLAAGLTLPVGRLARAAGDRLVSLFALAGAAMAAASIAFLLVSEQTQLFGFMEDGYGTPVVIALASEGAAVLLLGAYLLGEFSGWRRER
ncbi:MAG TPA: hypothetical protein VH025_10115 [Solirubrobacteraceae bacterium]|jgi:hypothetical protein|nr:hypothetical protein [Solirubrobacteraceae bacterium]